jgi:hypothetical protein
MPYQVSRTDTGQYVLIDPATDTVVIDDDLTAGFAKLEQAVADKPPIRIGPASNEGDPAARGGSAFGFRGGPRYTPILLAIVLPFAWLAVLYFALANLLSETALDRNATQETAARVEALERELQAVRSEIAGAPRTQKTRPPKPKPKPKPPAEVTVPAAAEVKPAAAPATEPGSKGPR